MMADVMLRLGREHVASRGLEERERRGVLERWRIGEIDDDARAGHRRVEAFAGQDVDAGRRRRGDHFMSLGAQARDDLAADAAGAADDDDFHASAP